MSLFLKVKQQMRVTQKRKLLRIFTYLKLELHVNDLYDLNHCMFILYNEKYASRKCSESWDQFTYAISSNISITSQN